MIYEVSNLPKNLDLLLLDKAIAFACKYLDLELDLIIEFVLLKKYQYGLCDYDEDETIITISKKLSKKELICTLFHELVHVKQYVDGRLESGLKSKWLGIEYDCTYNDLPWEQEAFDLEEKMMKEFENDTQ